MKIGIIGAGIVGSSLAKGWSKADHSLMLSSREPDSERMQALIAEIGGDTHAGSIEAVAAFGDVIVVAIGWANLIQALTFAFDWKGKVVIDTTNRFGPAPSNQSAAEDLTMMLPGAHVVKAFNTIGAEHMPHGTINGEQLSMFIAGDDAGAKSVVAGLVADVGFQVVDVGGLSAARQIENLAQLWVTLARGQLGRNIGFRLVTGS